MADNLKGIVYSDKSGDRGICSEASLSWGGTFIDYNGDLEPPPDGSVSKRNSHGQGVYTAPSVRMQSCCIRCTFVALPAPERKHERCKKGCCKISGMIDARSPACLCFCPIGRISGYLLFCNSLFIYNKKYSFYGSHL